MKPLAPNAAATKRAPWSEHMKSRLAFIASLLFITSCAVGPDYTKPDAAALTPPDWHWKIAEPQDTLPKGPWWEIFQDGDLNALESEAATNNQTLRAAVARVDAA